MSSSNHLAILKEGVDTWNKWREENPTVRPDLAGADLSGIDLSGVFFREAILSNASFEGSTLKKANFVGAKLQHSNFVLSDVSHSNFSFASLKGANFTQANLSKARLRLADMSDACLLQAHGYVFDINRVSGLRLSYNAKDPWSTLRRTYTGSRMAFNLVFLSLFALPHVGRLAFWTAVNEYQTQGEAVAIHKSSLCMAANCIEVPVWKLLLGIDKGYFYAGVFLLLSIYNLLRASLTYKVSLLKDEEDQSGCTPPWSAQYERSSPWAVKNRASSSNEGYRLLYAFHRVVSVLFVFSLVATAVKLFDWLAADVWLPV